MSEDLIRATATGKRGTRTLKLAHGYTVMVRRTATPEDYRSTIQLFADSEGLIWKENAAPETALELESDIRYALDGADDLDALADSDGRTAAKLGEKIAGHLETEASPGGGGGA